MALTEKLTSLQVMLDAPVIPVIVLNDVSHAVPMARALVAGGIRMLEITLRTSVALDCMRAIVEQDRQVEGHWTGYSPSLERVVHKKLKYLAGDLYRAS